MVTMLKKGIYVSLVAWLMVNLCLAWPRAHELQDVRELAPGVPIERELKGGEVHTYRITLTAGQFLRVVADQRGIDVVVKLFGPDGKQILEVDSPNGTQGPEPVSVIAEASGDYRLEARSLEEKAAAGRYEVKVEELRAATEQDKSRIAAERAFAEGEQLRAQGKAESLRKAIEKYEEALPLWRAAEDRRGEADTLHNIGRVHSFLGENQKALNYLNQALLLWRATGDRRGEADTLHNIGRVYWLLGENQKALESLNQALPWRRIVGDRQGEAKTLIGTGAVYTSLGDNQKALEHYHQALPLTRAVEDHQLEAATLANIGAVYELLGEPRKALEYYHQALPLSQALGDRQVEANTLNLIGIICRLLDEPQKALDSYNKALPLMQSLGDRRGEARTHNNIGLVYWSLGENQKAMEYYHQALPLIRAVGDRQGEANTLDNIGIVYSSLGELQKALEYFDQALALRRAVRDRRGEAATLMNIGDVYWLLSEPQKALEYYHQALPLMRAVENRRGEAATLHNIGNVNWSLGESQKALECYHQALLLSRAVEDRTGEAETLASVARAERDRGNLTEARTQSEAALDILESLRTKVASQELRASYLASKQSYYEFYTDLLMRLHQREPGKGHHAEALQASERARARSLLEILSEARADIRQGVEPELLQKERTLQQQLNAKAERLTRLLSGKHTDEQATAAKKEVDDLVTQLQETQAQIRSRSPRYAALTQPQPLSLKEIQQQVLDDETMLLEYALGDERSFLWTVTPTSINSYELPKRAEIDAAARRVYDVLRTRANAYPEALAALSRMILEPVAEQSDTKRLLIVPDGALQYVPFGALPAPKRQLSVVSSPLSKNKKNNGQRTTDNGQPLIVDHEIVTLPSASVLAVLRRELAGRKPAAKAVAVLADPVFESDDERVKTAQVKKASGTPGSTSNETPMLESELTRSVRDFESIRFERLPETRREAGAIMSTVPRGQGLTALDFAANRQTAMSPDLSRYRVVHFATHGLFNSQHPELSGLVFSLVNERGEPQDGFLRLHEVYNLNLPAELVVLSGCKTGLGKEIRGEGLIGLTRGFMYAGAPRVMVSLWDVSDVGTAELMKRFYRGMVKKGLRPAAALRAAQISMWKQKHWRAPYYWAGFVLQGEWR